MSKKTGKRASNSGCDIFNSFYKFNNSGRYNVPLSCKKKFEECVKIENLGGMQLKNGKYYLYAENYLDGHSTYEIKDGKNMKICSFYNFCLMCWWPTFYKV